MDIGAEFTIEKNYGKSFITGICYCKNRVLYYDQKKNQEV